MATNRTNPGQLEEKNKPYHTNDNKTHLEVGIIWGGSHRWLTGTTATKLGVEFRKARSRVGRGIWTEQETNPVRSGPWGTPASGERTWLA